MRTAKVTGGVVITLLIVAILAVGLPKFFGIRSFAVLSGSMTPEIRIGDLVYVKRVPFEDIHEGDVITFVLNEDLDVVTHRVTSIDREGQLLTTKGDANQTIDANPVWYPNVVGVVCLSVPQAGFVFSWFSSLSHKIIAMTVIIALFLVAVIIDLFLHITARRRHDDARRSRFGIGAHGFRSSPCHRALPACVFVGEAGDVP